MLVATGATQLDIIITISIIPLIMVKPIWMFTHQKPLGQPLQRGRSAPAPEAPIHMKEMGSLVGDCDLDRDDLQKPFLAHLLGAHDT